VNLKAFYQENGFSTKDVAAKKSCTGKKYKGTDTLIAFIRLPKPVELPDGKMQDCLVLSKGAAQDIEKALLKLGELEVSLPDEEFPRYGIIRPDKCEVLVVQDL
jgi:hypothetical protein